MGLYSVRDSLRRATFDHRVRGLLNGPPLELNPTLGLCVLSQLQHKDVLMYLGAVKSFARHVPIAEIQVIDDGTLTEADRLVLKAHVPGVQMHLLDEYRRPELPQGGTWERLIAIAQLSSKGYVVQLDADTLSLGSLVEVINAVQGNQAFVIGTWNGQEIESVAESASRARTALAGGGRHVQVIAESQLDQIAGINRLRYVRGCSGFSGFPQAPGKLDLIHKLSRQIEAKIGAIWRTWGSEQVMSNLVVANQPGAVVLPHPRYADCTKMSFPQTRFVHFIGTCRFSRGKYAELVRSLHL